MSHDEMPLYEGTKRLRARPMNKSEYCAYRGWQVPENEDPAEAGFLVEYQDGGKPNDERHEGYISWSPADVFSSHYQPCETHLDRMAIEFGQLSKRIGMLSDFIHTNPTFAKLSLIDQNLLKAQRDAMQTYLTILATRISKGDAA